MDKNLNTKFIIDYFRDVLYRLPIFAGVDIQCITALKNAPEGMSDYKQPYPIYIRIITPSYAGVMIAQDNRVRWTCGIVILRRRDDKGSSLTLEQAYSDCDLIRFQFIHQLVADSRENYRFQTICVHDSNIDNIAILNENVSAVPQTDDGCAARVVTFNLYLRDCMDCDKKYNENLNNIIKAGFQ
jgi:hypothetical protein